LIVTPDNALNQIKGRIVFGVPTALSKRVADDTALSAYVDRVETALPLK